MKKIIFISPAVRIIPIQAATPMAASVFGNNGIEQIENQYHDAESEGYYWE